MTTFCLNKDNSDNNNLNFLSDKSNPILKRKIGVELVEYMNQSLGIKDFKLVDSLVEDSKYSIV